jgi:hypothetical protein
LLARLGMAVSDNAILRQLKGHVRKQRKMEPLRAIAIDAQIADGLRKLF